MAHAGDELGEEAAAFVAEGEFQGLKLRLGRERPADGLAPSKRYAGPSARTPS